MIAHGTTKLIAIAAALVTVVLITSQLSNQGSGVDKTQQRPPPTAQHSANVTTTAGTRSKALPLHSRDSSSASSGAQTTTPPVANASHTANGVIGSKPPLPLPAATSTTSTTTSTSTTRPTTGSLSTTVGPSGEAMPTQAPTGYQTIVAQDFTGTTLPSGWHAYSGQPGSDTGGWWDPSHVTVGQGMLVLHAYEDATHYGQSSGPPWVEGGVDLWPDGVLTDGEYLVRSRVTSATGVTQVELLWPNSDIWPPEIDFNESNGTNESTAHLLYGPAGQPIRVESPSLTSIDLTQWHTWGVTVTPSLISFTLDGTVWATMENNPQEQVPMHLAIQQQVWPCNSQSETCPSAATPSEVDMQVDWAVVYAPLS